MKSALLGGRSASLSINSNRASALYSGDGEQEEKREDAKPSGVVDLKKEFVIPIEKEKSTLKVKPLSRSKLLKTPDNKQDGSSLSEAKRCSILFLFSLATTVAYGFMYDPANPESAAGKVTAYSMILSLFLYSLEISRIVGTHLWPSPKGSSKRCIQDFSLFCKKKQNKDQYVVHLPPPPIPISEETRSEQFVLTLSNF